MNLGGDEMKQAKAKLEEQFFPAMKWGREKLEAEDGYKCKDGAGNRFW